MTLVVGDCGVWLWLGRAMSSCTCRALVPAVVVCFGHGSLACLFVYLFLYEYRGDREGIPIRGLLLFIPYLRSHNPRMDVLGQTVQHACVCMSRFQLDKHPAHLSTAGPPSLPIPLLSIAIAMAEHGTRVLYHIPNNQKTKTKERKEKKQQCTSRPTALWGYEGH